MCCAKCYKRLRGIWPVAGYEQRYPPRTHKEPQVIHSLFEEAAYQYWKLAPNQGTEGQVSHE